jgi:hypothetical protein
MRVLFSSALAAVTLLSACGAGEGAPGSRTSVFKSMNSAQCGSSDSATLAVLKGQLAAANVQVHSSACGADGLVHAAVCGVAGGGIGIFDIPADQAAAAATAGFARLDTLPTAKVVACAG